ncbi:MAG: hypothetical protein J6T04_03515 [Bacteroidales bacterium]|nr:hypothetical protein [Bacteroidales bacterium]
METNTNSDLFYLQIDLQKVVAINATKGLTVDQALALIGAYVLQKSKFDTIESSAFEPYIRLLNNHFKGKRKTELLNSSFCDGVLAVNEWLQQRVSEEKKEWLLSFGLKVITGVDEGNNLSFNDKTFNYYSTKSGHINGGESPKLFEVGNLFERVDSEEDATDADNADFSEKATIEKIKGSEEFEDPNNLEPKQIRENVRPVEIDEKKGTRRIPKKAEEVNAPFVKLFNDLVKREDGSRSEDSFAWQWLLTLDEYNEIKSCVLNNVIPTSSAMFKSTASLFALYIGEFYKREYEGDNNPFGDISVDFKKLCVSLDINQYKKSNYAHLFSLYVRGGLPVHYISKKLEEDKTTSLIEALRDILNDDKKTQELGAEKLAKYVNNTAIKESYRQKHSIYDYIQALKNEDLTWNKADNEINDFKDFIKKLQPVLGKNEKFSIEYRFWSMSGFAENLTTCIRFKPNVVGDKRNYAINEEKLRSWGIPYDNLNSFSLSFSCGEKELKIPFFKCVNEDWVPFKCENIIKAEFPLFKKIRVKINDVEIQELSSPAIENGFVQMYSEDYRLWTSRRGKGSHYSIVIFDSSIWNSPESRCIGETDYEYVELKDGYCELFSNKKDKTIKFYNAVGNLRITPKHLFFQEGSFLNGVEAKFPCLIQGEEEPTYVYVTDHSGFTVENLLPVENLKEGNDVSHIESNEYKIEIYDKSLSRFKEVSDLDDYLGYQTLRFTYYDKQAILHCFFVDSKAKIERKVSENSKVGSINLSGLDCFKVSLDSNLVRINDNNNIVCNYDITRESRGCIIEITDKMQCKLQLEVTWPYDCSDIVYKEGSSIKLYEREAVPAIFAKKYEYRTFSKEGYSTSIISEDNRYEIYSFIFRYFTAKKKPNEFTKLGNNEKISIYSQNSEVSAHGFSVRLGERPDLKFVFVPIDKGECIDLHYDIEKNTLVLLPTNLIHQRGIIIQSLKGVDPHEYYEAKYKPALEDTSVKNKDRKDKQNTNINNYLKIFSKQDFRVAVRAFNIACDLNCYFGWFDELKALCLYEQPFEYRIVAFFKQYIDDCVQNNCDINYEGLWRLAGEFMFDWLLLPAACWRGIIKEKELYSKSLLKLLLERPGLNGSARYYTRQIFSKISGASCFGFRRARNAENKIAQCIRNEAGDEVLRNRGPRNRIILLKMLTDATALLTVDCLLSQMKDSGFSKEDG